MPRYEYQCNHCLGSLVLRRAIGEMDDPVSTLCCGATAKRLFTPTANLFVPESMKAVRRGGVEGGYSWSDFHDKSMKELAHTKELHGRKVEIVPTQEFLSRSGNGSPPTAEQRQAALEPAITKALDRAIARENIQTRS